MGRDNLDGGGRKRIAVIGAGMGGLVSALLLADAGHDVTVLERAAAPGGKMREVAAGGARIDSGPTVFTMRWVFEELFAEVGAAFADHVTLSPAGILARHAWDGETRLDLFGDEKRSADAIGDFAGAAEARGYLAFSARARRMYDTLEQPYIRAPLPSPVSLARAAGMGAMLQISPFATLWRALGEHFRDPRLLQLFGRYATYCGASPYAAPATLMLVAHVEREGVWLVEGGMHRLAAALAALAEARGARFRYGCGADAIALAHGRVAAVVLASGERIAADAVVANADAAALAAGRFGREVAGAVPPVAEKERSLSALTVSMLAEPDGFPLVRHNVFFSADYAAEFRDIAAGRLPGAPTVYVCAQDRDDAAVGPGGAERLFTIVNAPPTGDARAFTPAEIEACQTTTTALLARCGLRLRTEAAVTTTPARFEALFPATGGALYGRAPHGSMGAFRRPGARSRVPGLYLAGGSTHPGAGVPMAALSGRQAAASLLADLASTRPSRVAATPGGMSTG